MALLDHALKYAAEGVAIFPVHYPIDGKKCSCSEGAKCKHIGKHPAIAHGFKNATLNESDIRARWRDRPFNIGAPAGRLFDVLDEDPAKGGRDALEALEARNGALPSTLVSNTGGGGRHFFFQPIPGVKNNNDGSIGPGLDFKTDGGYVVLPPSLHLSGKRYEWSTAEDQIVTAPGWLVDLLRKQFPAEERPRRPAGYWASLAAGVEAGDRHNAVASVAGLLLGKRALSVVDINLAVRLVHGFNHECCDPPKSRGEVDAIIAYVLRKNK